MRTLLNLLRTIPDLVLAVIFVGLFGVGVFPGILALAVFSLGILAKLISETIESVDMNPLEAMRAFWGKCISSYLVLISTSNSTTVHFSSTICIRN